MSPTDLEVSALRALIEADRMSVPLQIISLGAGVQSSTMALMAAAGEIGPMPAAAIFADTQAEPASVYRWLDWLEGQLPFPVLRVTGGSLAADSLRIRTSKRGHRYVRPMIPAFARFASGEEGLWWRKCTTEYKIRPIIKTARRLAREAGRKEIIQWIGISVDEAHRMKDSRERRISKRYPLVDMGISRRKCLEWMEARNYPKPPRSACVFCPFHNDREWQRLQREEPEEFRRAAEYERQLQAAARQCETTRGVPYLHRGRRPIEETVFDLNRQTDLFGNECEGMCGV